MKKLGYDEITSILSKNEIEWQVITSNHIKIFIKEKSKWINFYCSNQSFNFDGDSRLSKGIDSLISYVKTGKLLLITEHKPISKSNIGVGVTKIKFKKVDPMAYNPSKKYDNDAGVDLFSLHDVEWKKNDGFWIANVRTGISMEVPVGCHLGTAPRSSNLYGKKIGCFYSVIDCGYKGEITFLMFYFGNSKPDKINRGDKVAQVIYIYNPIISTEFEEVDELPNYSPRGFSGFGSTGNNANDIGIIEI